MTTATEVLDFWRKAGPQKWFARDDAFDAAIRERFEAVHHAAARGEHDHWAGSPDGALALLILLDQFPRNLYRGSAHAHATDGKARAIARKAVASGQHLQADPALRSFYILPFQHSEDMADQERGVALCRELGDVEQLKWCAHHRDIIGRFGRFPHRNSVLGRQTTPDEQAWLDDGGFTG